MEVSYGRDSIDLEDRWLDDRQGELLARCFEDEPELLAAVEAAGIVGMSDAEIAEVCGVLESEFAFNLAAKREAALSAKRVVPCHVRVRVVGRGTSRERRPSHLRRSRSSRSATADPSDPAGSSVGLIGGRR